MGCWIDLAPCRQAGAGYGIHRGEPVGPMKTGWHGRFGRAACGAIGAIPGEPPGIHPGRQTVPGSPAHPCGDYVLAGKAAFPVATDYPLTRVRLASSRGGVLRVWKMTQ